MNHHSFAFSAYHLHWLQQVLQLLEKSDNLEFFAGGQAFTFFYPCLHLQASVSMAMDKKIQITKSEVLENENLGLIWWEGKGWPWSSRSSSCNPLIAPTIQQSTSLVCAALMSNTPSLQGYEWSHTAVHWFKLKLDQFKTVQNTYIHPWKFSPLTNIHP